MPRIRPISYKKFERFLKSVGCRFIRQSGDHIIYRKEGLKRPIVFPREKQIPVTVIMTNLRTLGISREEYLEIIERI